MIMSRACMQLLSTRLIDLHARKVLKGIFQYTGDEFTGYRECGAEVSLTILATIVWNLLTQVA